MESKNQKNNTLVEKILSRTIMNDNGCLVWQGAHISNGYGQIRNKNGSTLVHRIVWESFNGPIMNQLTIDHLCRTKDCVNIDHMELVTLEENVRRAAPWERHKYKSVCQNGHEYTHTIKTKNGTERRCRECHRQNQARYLTRRAERLSG